MARATTRLFEADVRALIAKYEGRISTAEAIGVLTLQVYEIAENANGADDDAQGDEA